MIFFGNDSILLLLLWERGDVIQEDAVSPTRIEYYSPLNERENEFLEKSSFKLIIQTRTLHLQQNEHFFPKYFPNIKRTSRYLGFINLYAKAMHINSCKNLFFVQYSTVSLLI